MGIFFDKFNQHYEVGGQELSLGMISFLQDVLTKKKKKDTLKVYYYRYNYYFNLSSVTIKF